MLKIRCDQAIVVVASAVQHADTIRCGIAEDEELRASLDEDHRRYASARWALLTSDEQQHAIDAGYATTLRDKGIGGIADFTRIKCLHLHLAHHLAEEGGTTVGRLIEARLEVAPG